MWTRKELKEKAKKVIKKNYWTILIVCFIMAVCTGEYGDSSINIGRNEDSADIINSIQSFDENPSEISEDETAEQITQDYMDEFKDTLNTKVNIAVKAQKYIYKIRDGVESFLNNDKIGAIVLFVGATLAFLFIVFVADPLIVGEKRFFLKVRRSSKARIGVLASIFKKDQWANIAKNMLIKNIFMFLWLLIIPLGGVIILLAISPTVKSFLNITGTLDTIITYVGVIVGLATIIAGIVIYAIKSYEYRMIPYLMAENPHLKEKEVFKLTKQMMKKNKWKTFVLDVSFILWYMLSGATLGFAAILYVNPYTETTKTELYVALRNEAVKKKYQYYEKLVKPRTKKEELKEA